MSSTNSSLSGARVLVGQSLRPIPEEIVREYQEGDRLLGLPDGTVLRIPREQAELTSAAVGRAADAFQQLSSVSQDRVTRFYELFAAALDDDAAWADIQSANDLDVERAQTSGRSTTRLAVSEKMRREMVAGLLTWARMSSPVAQVLSVVEHNGWKVESIYSPLGVVAFVFEGRPNVFADASGVLRSGNATVLRIGGDALDTARAMMTLAVRPALKASGLPEDAVTLVESRDHAAGWALFSDQRVALAVARGSGRAVTTLGAIARQHGIPVSQHGTGGAWMVVTGAADVSRLEQVILHSLDRKVCNTLNVLCLPRQSAPEFVQPLMRALETRRKISGYSSRLHVTPEAEKLFPAALFAPGSSDCGPSEVAVASLLPVAELGREWEWDQNPELSVTTFDRLQDAISLFNRYSPRFTVSLISEDPLEHTVFFNAVDAPFVGDGFTRWVDGQFALDRPELGLSNWEGGRLLGRSGILSGDGIYTVRMCARQADAALHR